MLINLTNHPSANWSKEQTTAARVYGTVIDYPFPQVNPCDDEATINSQAFEIVNGLLTTYDNKEITVHLMGEFTMTFALLRNFATHGIPCVASTTERIVTETEPGKKNVEFRFVRFRKYF